MYRPRTARSEPRPPRPSVPEYWMPENLHSILTDDSKTCTDTAEDSEKFHDFIQKLKNLDRLELSECHYLQFLKFGLYLEEFQQNIDLRKYNLYSKKIEKYQALLMSSNSPSGILFKIPIDDLDKDHPVNKACKLIQTINTKDERKQKLVLRVRYVRSDHVIASAYPEFCESYDPENEYDIRFRFNSYPFRCSHYALSLLDEHRMTSYLFPSKRLSLDCMKPTTPQDEEKWFNPNIAKNPEQKTAVRNIRDKSSFPAPYVLYGPPGTGKTSTLVEAVCQIWKKFKEERDEEKENQMTGNWRRILDGDSDKKEIRSILVCAPSNAAADVVAKRLLKYIPEKDIDRVYGRSRDCSLIDKELRRCCSNYTAKGIQSITPEAVSSKTVVISTLNTCTRLIILELTSVFSYVFIDEAGQSMEPESLIAFNVINSHGSSDCQIVISGDPQQLGPGVRSKYAEPILGQSILERLMKMEPYVKCNNNEYDSRYITKLLQNYRSHPAIIRVSNELFYENELIASKKETLSIKEFPKDFPVIFHSVMDGKEERQSNSSSSHNEAEVKQVVEYVHLLIGEKIGDKEITLQDIGIVTPFTLQSKYLKDRLKEEHLDDITVGTVEIFQGQEKEVIIISTVRTKTFSHDDREHIGFLSNPKRFNVALTRAKALLIVIGNPKVLQIDKNWLHFIKFCRENNACRGSEFELSEASEAACGENSDENRKSEQSIDMFSETFQLLNIHDGIVRQKRNRHLFNGQYYRERKCTIL
ncbi:hypothetical protein QAD02_012297 [Eretmocerus hayati]|uniref:Uncharacterized protein n=1 Tax=Eretmocerus hayati TaxID=131215 RepID=A0ACC2NZ20_9HYME|nr:hypothetical protein QAD02_012297 [Eretmocerus hayati]